MKTGFQGLVCENNKEKKLFQYQRLISLHLSTLFHYKKFENVIKNWP
jgi:hypothetical protein